MENFVQLLFPLNTPDHAIQLPSDSEEDVVAAVACLLLQIVAEEKREEVEDEHQH